MSKKVLVVVDMQNDFVTGALGTEEAKAIVPALVEFIKSFDGTVVYTKDNHSANYLESQEGKRLPVEHCIYDTPGWNFIPELGEFKEKTVFTKDTFGSLSFGAWLQTYHPFDEIHFCGVCTGICVISNAVIAKAASPESRIVIHKDLCACVTPESHETALKSMATLQMDIV